MLFRSTKYKPEYCKILEDHLASGCSVQSVLADIPVSSAQEIYDWIKKYPEFALAHKNGKAKAMKLDEQLLRTKITGIIQGKIDPKRMDVQALLFKLRTVHHEIYSEHQKIDMQIKNKTIEDLILETKNKKIKGE